MLDLTKLAKAMQGISQHLTTEATASRQRLELAAQLLAAAYAQQTELVQRQQKWRDRILFAAASPVEPLNTCIDLPVSPACSYSSLPQTVPKLLLIITRLPTAICLMLVA